MPRQRDGGRPGPILTFTATIQEQSRSWRQSDPARRTTRAPADSDPSPEIGQYNWVGYDPSNPPPLVKRLTIGGLPNPSNYLGPWRQATILNDYNGVDGVTISSYDAHGIGRTFKFDFSASNLLALNSDGFPLSLDPRKFNLATFAFMGSNPTSHPGFRGTLLAQTPIPPSAGLFGFALAGLIGTAWWKTRRARTTEI